MSYKLLSFKSGAEARSGLLVDGKGLRRGPRDGQAPVVLCAGALQDWPKAHREFAAFAKRIAAGKGKAKGAPLSRVKLLAPVLYPGNIYCAGAKLHRPHGRGWRVAQGKEAGRPTDEETWARSPGIS